jgi:RimJ/RimL family protein N-acetyltransferase
LSASADFDAKELEDITMDLPHLQLDDTPSVAVRPIEPTDRAALASAFARLGRQSRVQRFLGPKRELSAHELTYLTDIDHVTHEALAAFDTERQIIAVARYAAVPATCEAAEVAVAVVDSWQGRGIGSALAARIVGRAQDNGFARLTAGAFWGNVRARSLLARLGFRPVGGGGDGVVNYQLELPAIRPRAA